jgi:hypothetical protein
MYWVIFPVDSLCLMTRVLASSYSYNSLPLCEEGVRGRFYGDGFFLEEFDSIDTLFTRKKFFWIVLLCDDV